MQKKRNLKCISLFSGGGGLDLGLEAAGFETVVATDIDEHSCASLVANKAAASLRQSHFLKNADIVCRDVTKLNGQTLMALAQIEPKELDLLAGGPPCQAFSIFGKRQGTADERGKLVFHYLRLLSELQPKAFVFENVFGLLSIEGGKVFETLCKELSNPSLGLNYTISVHRVNSADVGVPQFRDRVFIIGSREGRQVTAIEKRFCSPEESKTDCLPWRTVAQALKGVPDQGFEGWHNHIGRKHSQRIIDRYDGMMPSERDHFTRINRLNLARPSYAIIVGSDSGGGKGHVHPTLPREVTPRESARMQCFPDWWWFSGTSRHPIRQVGNAVPTLLGYAIGRSIVKYIFASIPNSFTDAVKMLNQQHLFSEADLRFVENLDENGQLIDHPQAKAL